jgi:alanine racemase
MVKSNAYGHGLVKVSRTVLSNGADCLGVKNFNEGVKLREAGINSPILILNPINNSDLRFLFEYDLTSTIIDIDNANALSQLALTEQRRIPIHVNIDTGLGRLGVHHAKAVAFIEKVSKLPNIDIEGIYTQMVDTNYSHKQFQIFMGVVRDLERGGTEPALKHMANSATILHAPHMCLDMVRIGILIYGVYPPEDVPKNLNLKSAMELKTNIIRLRRVSNGSRIGYGYEEAFVAPKDMRVALLPIGYYNGLPRHLSNNGEVIIKGKRAKIVGPVMMNDCIVDVSDITGVKIGDEAVVIGRQRGEKIAINEIAEKAQTIGGDVFCAISNSNDLKYICESI